MSNIASLLEDLEKDEFDATQEPKTGFENPPDGEYDAIVEDVIYHIDEANKKEYYAIRMNIPSIEMKYSAFYNLTGKMANFNLKKLMNDLYKITGEVIPKKSFLQSVKLVASLKKTMVNSEIFITLKTSAKGFQNCTIEEVEFEDD